MKKVALVVLSSVAALYATSITVPTGWSLLGAINGISPSQITCANTVWTYTGSAWNLYTKTAVSGNYGFSPISAINMGQGFWVNNTSGSSCILDFNATTPVVAPTYYDAYGFHFFDIKADSTFTVSNALGTNNVTHNSSLSTFDFKAYRSDDNDSKAGIKVDLTAAPLSAIQATTNLATSATSGYNKSQLNIGRLDITNDTSLYGSTGIVLNKNGAFIWFETYNNSTNALVSTPLANLQISTANMTGKNVTSKMMVNGSTIYYNVNDGISDYNSSFTTNVSPNNIVLGGGIKSVVIRARNDDRTTTDGGIHSADVTEVKLLDVKGIAYNADINATPVTTVSFADLSSFIMFDKQGLEYTKITKNASTFSATDYDYNGTTWSPNGGPSGTVSGNRITMTATGGVYEFAILGTQKINSALGNNFTDLYMSQATTTCITAPSTFEYDVWGWDNPTYYNSSTSQQVAITNLATLVAGFTAPDQGMRFGGGSEATMFLNAGGTVVEGTWDGVSYYPQCTDDCRIFTRTTNVVGSWTNDANKIYVEVPKESLTFEVVNQSGTYRIQEGWKDKVGAVDNQFIFSGTQAIDAVVQTYLSSPSTN